MGCSSAKTLEITNKKEINKEIVKDDNNESPKENLNNNINIISQNPISQVDEILSINKNVNTIEEDNQKNDLLSLNENLTNKENSLIINNKDNLNNEKTIKQLNDINTFEELNLEKSEDNNSFLENNTLISMNSSFYENEKENLNEIYNIKEEISNSNLTILNVIVNANRYEAMYPIWIEKNKEITFNVSGKWKIDNIKECSSIGINEFGNEINTNFSDNNNNNFNNGALIGRIFNEKPFVIYDNLKYLSHNSSPLFLKMNITSLFNKILPSGKLFLKITGAQNIDSFDKIDEMIGWEKHLKEIEFNNNENNLFVKLSYLDKETIIFFNKIRFNSNLFAIQYLNNIENLTQATQKLYKFMIDQNKKMEKFKVNFSIMKLIENFYKPFFGRNKLKNKNNSILNSSQDLENYLIENFQKKKKIKVIIKKHECNKPMSLCIKFLLNEEIRNEIFNEENKEISLLTLRTRKRQKIGFFSFIVFSNEEGNKDINFIKEKIKFSYSPSYTNINKSTKTNLEIINEEKIRNKNLEKKKLSIRFKIKKDLEDNKSNYSNYSNKSSKNNFNEMQKEEINKNVYKSDDEGNIRKKSNDVEDDEEDE